MQETNKAEMRLTWAGQEYSCRPDHRTIMLIEERVLLHKLGSRIAQGADQIPVSHLVWAIYCFLYSAGARCTADDVYEAANDGRLDAETMVAVARWVIAEVYGAAPKQEEVEEEKKT